MSASNDKPSLTTTALTGLLVDGRIRRAALDALPPLARLGLAVGVRHARVRSRRARRKLLIAGALLGAGGAGAAYAAAQRRPTKQTPPSRPASALHQGM